MTVTFNMGG
jgi:hypothetical protein